MKLKRFTFFIFLTISGLNINAQSKLFVSVDVSPILSYRGYKVGDYSKETSTFPSGKVIFDTFKQQSDSIEESRHGFQVSFNLGYFITDKFSIQSGFQYKNIGINMKPTYFPTGAYIIDGQSVPIYTNSSTNEIKQYTSFNYFGLPLNLQYKVFSFAKFNVGLNVGCSFDFLLSHKTIEIKMNRSSVTKESYSSYPSIAMSIQGGIPIGYMINDKFEVFIMPQYATYLTPNVKFNLNASNDFNCKINQYNIFGELKFGLKYRI